MADKEFRFNNADEAASLIDHRFYNKLAASNDELNMAMNQLMNTDNWSYAQKETSLVKLAYITRNSRGIDPGTKSRLYNLVVTFSQPGVNEYQQEFSDFQKQATPAAPQEEFANYAAMLTKLRATDPSVYAGIEVGSSAVKLSVVKLMADDEHYQYFKVICEPATKDINSRNFTLANFKLIAAKVREFYDCIGQKNGFEIPAGKIFISYSSGFCGNFYADNRASSLDTLDAEIRKALSEPQRRITHLSQDAEATFTHLGLLIDSVKHNNSLILDIGDGNTKGGFFPIGATKLTAVGFALASGTLKDRIGKLIGSNASVKDYATAVDSYLNANRQAEIFDPLSQMNAVSNQREVYFSGGIAWVIFTLLHPNDNSTRPMTINRSQLRELIEQITNNYPRLLDQATVDYRKSLKKVVNPGDCVDCTTKDFIFDKFDEKKCLAGAKIMLAVMDQLDSSSITKQYYVTNTGKLSWLNAFVMRSLL